MDLREFSRNFGGLLNEIFPLMNSGFINGFNEKYEIGLNFLDDISVSLMQETNIMEAFLFEFCLVFCEARISDNTLDLRRKFSSLWAQTILKQKKYYDCHIKKSSALSSSELDAIVNVAHKILNNFLIMKEKLTRLQTENNLDIVISPVIPGFGTLDPSYADYSIGETLIEVKCTKSKFSTADYNQVFIYWLLSTMWNVLVDNKALLYKNFSLVNLRRGELIYINGFDFAYIVSGGKNFQSIIQMFSNILNRKLST